MKQVIIGVIAVVAIIGAAIVFGKNDSTTSNGTPTSHIYGNEQASVTLVEYGDLECPACYGFYPIVKQLKEQYKDKLRFEYRNFPLVQAHQHALAAHRALEAASNQGKFWEMHDILYERQEDWNGPSSTDPVGIQIAQAIAMFEGYAKELGLNVEQFKTDVEVEKTLASINADIARGNADGVDSTPTFFLNGKKIESTTEIGTYAKFAAKIDEALGIKSDSSTTPSEQTASPTPPPTNPESTTPTEPAPQQ